LTELVVISAAQAIDNVLKWRADQSAPSHLYNTEQTIDSVQLEAYMVGSEWPRFDLY